jgi:S-formylglutathione hydrolase FrmB
MISVTNPGAYGQEIDFFDTSFYSPILDETKMMRIYLPPGYHDDTLSYPIVFYLHGAYGNYTQLLGHMPEIQHMIDTEYIHPMLVVGLDGQCEPFSGSLYTNSILYGNYEDYIMTDAIPFAESILRVKDPPQYRCAMGFAMGGYGSVKLGLKYPEEFTAVASYAGILQLDTTLVLWRPEVLTENSGPPYNYQYGAGIFTSLIFTAAGAWSPNLLATPYQVEFPYDSLGNIVDSVFMKWKTHDCSRLAKELDSIYYDDLSIFFTCGLYDYLLFHPTNTCFADTLSELGIDHQFLSTTEGHIVSDTMLRTGMHFLDSVMHDTLWVGNAQFCFDRVSTLSVYPNPTSGVSSFRLQVSGSDYVTLKIYDLQGRELAMVVDEWMPAGEHRLTFDASDLIPGVYIFCISYLESRISNLGKLVVVR